MIVEKESSRPSKSTLWESDTVPPGCLSIEPVEEWKEFLHSCQHPEVSLLLITHRKKVFALLLCFIIGPSPK